MSADMAILSQIEEVDDGMRIAVVVHGDGMAAMIEDAIAVLAERWISGEHEHVLDVIANQDTSIQAAHAALSIALLVGIDGPEQLARALERRAETEAQPSMPRPIPEMGR